MSVPRVLAFVRAWDPATQAPRELARIRAELRGLGARLTVVAAAGTWSFHPDDDLERWAPGQGAALAAEHELDPDRDAVLVLHGAGGVRFSHVADGALPTTLGEALRGAGLALLARPGLVFNRREWALSSLCAGFALALLGCKGTSKAPPAEPPPAPVAPGPAPAEYDVVLAVNGTERELRLDPRVSLLDALRERLDLPGTKKGCDHGQCGACTVHLDGTRVNACLTLAIMAQGKAITTIEGLAGTDGTLHPVQAAFVEHDGFQCGYCTPGQIMSAVALLAEGHAISDAEVREGMSGNLCRCGAYPNIVAAVQAARKGA